MAQHLQVAKVVKAGNASVGADQRLDVVDLQLQLVSRVSGAGDRVFTDHVGLEAAALAGPFGAAPGSPARCRPDMVFLELTGVLVGAVGSTSRRQRGAAACQTADLLRQIDAGNEVAPGRGFELSQESDLPPADTGVGSVPSRMRRVYALGYEGSPCVREHRGTGIVSRRKSAPSPGLPATLSPAGARGEAQGEGAPPGDSALEP